MTVCDKFRQLLFKPNGFAFDPATGQSYLLSATALRILHWLQEGCGEEDIPQRLALEYDTAPHVARCDAESFLATLRAYKLL